MLKEKQEFQMMTDIHTKKGNREMMFVWYFKYQTPKWNVNRHTHL